MKNMSQINFLLNSYVTDPFERPKVLAIALATALSASLEVPAGQVENLTGWFTMQHRASVNQIISRVNERLPLNVSLAVDATSALFCVRCFTSQTSRLTADPTCGSVLSFFTGANRFLSKEMCGIMDQHGKAIIALSHRFQEDLAGELNVSLVNSTSEPLEAL